MTASSMTHGILKMHRIQRHTAVRISLLAECLDKSVLVESLGYTCRGCTGATAPRVPAKYDARRALLVNGGFLGHLLFIGLGLYWLVVVASPLLLVS